jgi:hypothetical protein
MFEFKLEFKLDLKIVKEGIRIRKIENKKN